MGTHSVTDRARIGDYRIFASVPGMVEKFAEWQFIAPTGTEDPTINQLLFGDLVYFVANDKIRKIQLGGGFVLPEKAIIGVVTLIKDINHNVFHSLNVEDPTQFTSGNGTPFGRLFEAQGGAGTIGVYTGQDRGCPINAKNVYLHSVEQQPNTRVPFDFATHGVAGGVLAGRVNLVNSSEKFPQFVFEG